MEGAAQMLYCLSRIRSASFLMIPSPGGAGGILPYMGYIGMCRRIGYGFWRFSILK